MCTTYYATYSVSYSNAEALDIGEKEFDTYGEAKAFYDQYLLSGYSVAMHEIIH